MLLQLQREENPSGIPGNNSVVENAFFPEPSISDAIKPSVVRQPLRQVTYLVSL